MLKLDKDFFATDGEVRILIDDREKKQKRSISQSSSLSHIISSYPTPKNGNDLVKLIEDAEKNPDMRDIFDRALAPFCVSRQLAKHISNPLIGWRFFRLKLPESTSRLIETTRFKRTVFYLDRFLFRWIENDQGGPLANLLQENRLTEGMLEEFRIRTFTNYPHARNMKSCHSIAELFAKTLENRLDKDGLLRSVSLDKLFIYFLFLINVNDPYVIHPNFESIQMIFLVLIDPMNAEELGKKRIDALTRIALLHEPYSSMLSKGKDFIKIRCLDDDKQAAREFTASRFLLMQSGYLSKEMNPASDEIDLCGTELTSLEVGSILKWLSHTHPSQFSFGQIGASNLEKLLICSKKCALHNQQLFTEVIQLNLIRQLSQDSIIETLAISLRNDLAFVTHHCILFINSIENSSVKIHELKPGLYEVAESENEDPPPPFVYEAIKLLRTQIKYAKISHCRPHFAQSGCGKAFHRLKNLGGQLWEKGKGAIKRTAFFALSILAAKRGQNWNSKIDFSLATGLGLVYPVLEHLLQKHLIERCGRNSPPKIIALSMLVPVSLQIKSVNLRERIHHSFCCCLRRRRSLSVDIPLIQRNCNPLWGALPRELEKLNLVQAKDLIDEDLAMISLEFPSLNILELGYHPCLSTSQFASLYKLHSLSTIKFNFERGQTPGALNALELSKFYIRENHPLNIEVELFDTNLLYFSLHLFKSLPQNSCVKILLKHAPFPLWTVLFQNHPALHESEPWPGTYEALVNSFQKINELETYIRTSNRDLAILKEKSDVLYRLSLFNYPSVNAEGIEALTQMGSLEELMIRNSDIVDKNIEDFFTTEPKLKKIALAHCPHVTDASLEQFAGQDTLSSCRLTHLNRITDKGVSFLLKREPLIEEIVVNECDEITPPTLREAFPRSYPTLRRELEQEDRLKVFWGAIPPILLYKIMVPVILESSTDFLLSEKINALRAENPPPFTISLSCLQESAALYLDSFISRLMESESLHPPAHPFYDKNRPLWMSFFSSSEMQRKEFSRRLKDGFSIYLKERFSPLFHKEVKKLAHKFAKTFQIPELELLIREVLPVAFLSPKKLKSFLYDLFLSTDSHLVSSMKQIYSKIIKNIKLNGWTQKEVVIAFLGIFMMNIERIGDILTASQTSPIKKSHSKKTLNHFFDTKERKHFG